MLDELAAVPSPWRERINRTKPNRLGGKRGRAE
jgi:hypothetical protein